MAFKPMDPSLARALLEGQVDVITPAAQREATIYDQATCPVCGQVGADKAVPSPKIIIEDDGDVQIIRAPFNPATHLIQGHAKCRNCGSEYNPLSGLIISQPEPVLSDPNFPDE